MPELDKTSKQIYGKILKTRNEIKNFIEAVNGTIYEVNDSLEKEYQEDLNLDKPNSAPATPTLNTHPAPSENLSPTKAKQQSAMRRLLNNEKPLKPTPVSQKETHKPRTRSLK
ncbi:hypothetical protein JTB14_035538 [Gonioctena quinquepunctata]|nr:hypothetical protein JTB14_035538 [Gonioctena quinquepunctata]